MQTESRRDFGRASVVLSGDPIIAARLSRPMSAIDVMVSRVLSPAIKRAIENGRCTAQNCYERAIFGYFLDDVPILCEKHVIDGCYRVDTPKCRVPGCQFVAEFGDAWTRIAVRCEEHKLVGQVSIVAESLRMKRARESLDVPAAPAPKRARPAISAEAH
jgi:hypothetical protein